MRNRHQMWVRWQGGSSCQSSTPALISTENQNSRMTSWLFRWCHTFSWALVTGDLWGNHLHKLEKYGLTGKIRSDCANVRDLSLLIHVCSLNAVFVERLWVMWAAQRLTEGWRCFLPQQSAGASILNPLHAELWMISRSAHRVSIRHGLCHYLFSLMSIWTCLLFLSVKHSAHLKHLHASLLSRLTCRSGLNEHICSINSVCLFLLV